MALGDLGEAEGVRVEVKGRAATRGAPLRTTAAAVEEDALTSIVCSRPSLFADMVVEERGLGRACVAALNDCFEMRPFFFGNQKERFFAAAVRRWWR